MLNSDPAIPALSRTSKWSDALCQLCIWLSTLAHKLELQQQIAKKQAAAEALRAEHARLVARNSMLEKVLDTQQTSVNILQGNGQESPNLKPFSISSQHQQHALQGLHHTQQGFPALDTHSVDEEEDYCKTYAGLVEGLKQLLDRLDTEGCDADMHLQLQNQTRAAGYCMKQALLMNPDSMQHLLMGTIHQPSMGTGHTSFTSRRDWQLVTESLQMTPEQRDQILRLRANFLQEQADHQAQWRLLCQCMKQGKEAVKAEAYREALKQTPNGFYRRQLYVLEVNLRQQQAMWVDLHHSIFYEVWTPEQCARVIVETGLHFVDALAIAHCVAQQMLGGKEESQDEKLMHQDHTN
ncbi:MAG: hypothetical protein FRX49_02059 [Trebouxia sp. A1-2]|nr:MAG: hypothetical protein FRX49_02059 [Trebouxia sp. A1-2]